MIDNMWKTHNLFELRKEACYGFKFITVINATWTVTKESLKKSRLEWEPKQ